MSLFHRQSFPFTPGEMGPSSAPATRVTAMGKHVFRWEGHTCLPYPSSDQLTEIASQALETSQKEEKTKDIQFSRQSSFLCLQGHRRRLGPTPASLRICKYAWSRCGESRQQTDSRSCSLSRTHATDSKRGAHGQVHRAPSLGSHLRTLGCVAAMLWYLLSCRQDDPQGHLSPPCWTVTHGCVLTNCHPSGKQGSGSGPGWAQPAGPGPATRPREMSKK